MEKEFGKSLLRSPFIPLWLFWPLYFACEEGDTTNNKILKRGNGGKYNSTSAHDFDGYPDHSTSPYKLPFKKGNRVCCVQGNQGIWSHNAFSSNSQVYAYDFGLDKGEEVLACRDGIVVDYFDWVPDEKNEDTPIPTSPPIVKGGTQKDNWNFVLIRHDTLDPDHDKDENGAQTTTYCQYGHGLQGSVRKVFAQRSTPPSPPSNIIGQRVKQGDVIMLAGDTGRSAYNHLHIHVRPEPQSFTVPSTGVVFPSDLEPRTIPFVFRDAKHEDLFTIIKWGQDGSPKSLNWYKSDNG